MRGAVFSTFNTHAWLNQDTISKGHIAQRDKKKNLADKAEKSRVLAIHKRVAVDVQSPPAHAGYALSKSVSNPVHSSQFLKVTLGTLDTAFEAQIL